MPQVSSQTDHSVKNGDHLKLKISSIHINTLRWIETLCSRIPNLKILSPLISKIIDGPTLFKPPIPYFCVTFDGEIKFAICFKKYSNNVQIRWTKNQ